MQVQTSNVWARPETVASTAIRQLLVPEGRLELVEDAENLYVTGPAGTWPATRARIDPSVLTAQVPVLDQTRPIARWIGPTEPIPPDAVVNSYRDAIGFQHWDEQHSLRRPQIGALHAIMGHWASGTGDPAIVVMPTGTGKTETMIATAIAQRVPRLLVLVPSVALRRQITSKFLRLGILQREHIVAPHALRPQVAALEHGLSEPDDAAQLMDTANVVIATPAVLRACSDQARAVIIERATHLFVDEAHHAPAPTWATVVEGFADRPVLLFTATPAREDGRPLPGRVIFRFPLREAQRDGYFTRIDHRAVLSLTGADEAIALLAVERLEQDLAAGRDHILMVRAGSVDRAKALHKVYERVASRHHPQLLHDRVRPRPRRAVMKALAERTSRVVVCVNMLGEGFDMPSLKIAAIHDTKKSLGPMIQFIGRFTRGVDDPAIGTPSVFIVRDPTLATTPLRALLREDADWNLLLRDLTEDMGRRVQDQQEFDASFADAPDEVPAGLLAPKMSAIAHRAPSASWDPDRAVQTYGAERVLGERITVGANNTVAWFIVEHRTDVRWAELPEICETSYELVILYFQPESRVLCIHGSGNAGNYAELAASVLGGDTTPINGPNTFRVFGGLDRLTPTNVGLLDVRDHFNRFSMHVGSDVSEAIDDHERGTRSQTHIATNAFDAGERVSISASLSGRFWSVRTADSLKAWVDWCHEQTEKLLDSDLDLESIQAGFIIPVDIDQRPNLVLLGLEWPWELYLGVSEGPTVTYDGQSAPLIDIGFNVDDHGREGPLLFSLVSDHWQIPYRADFTQENGLKYRPNGAGDGRVTGRSPQPLGEWINNHRPTLFFERDHLVTDQGRMLAPRIDLLPFDPDKLISHDWAGTTITVESQGVERRPDSIQAQMSRYLQLHHTFAVLVDDDRAGEAADLVGLAVNGEWFDVTLVHCKYSSAPQPGARLADLYELCGQAVRGARWRQHGAIPLLRHLQRRAERYAQRTGRTPFEVGDIDTLVTLHERAPQLRPRFRTVLVQPGLSKRRCGEEHLRLLAGAESYVRSLTKGTFEIRCSE
ncbi:DEAD/DEAH box helicase [Pseudonocardia endophytica]|uniref:Superfamily II DNA or RNA helicase n=1 Tax=Pseudonocardia endophytica TaxID=401976 RepID=A0A4R1HI76_PSEEN|nr:DEAD/DEAH box helicase family protein [Pseudonocardia endophytica]TCK21947.1 superfamily II DNA or RNA helicase [Pseudonocardia endophytica]